MDVFISWSGDLSKNIAELLIRFIQNVIQSTCPFLSPETEKGIEWFSKLRTQLDSAKIGVICVTDTNKNKPWILFEAGALSSNSRKVCPVLIDLSIDEINHPLWCFQYSKVDMDDIFKLIKTINGELENPLSTERLSEAFNVHWGGFKRQFDNIISNVNPLENINNNNKLANENGDESKNIQNSNIGTVRILNMEYSLHAILYLVELQIKEELMSDFIHYKETYPFCRDIEYREEVLECLIKHSSDNLNKTLQNHFEICNTILEKWENKLVPVDEKTDRLMNVVSLLNT